MHEESERGFKKKEKKDAVSDGRKDSLSAGRDRLQICTYPPTDVCGQNKIASAGILISTPPPSWKHRSTGNGYGLLSHPTFRLFAEQFFPSCI
jgi:hypothetical protein